MIPYNSSYLKKWMIIIELFLNLFEILNIVHETLMENLFYENEKKTPKFQTTIEILLR
jgi:hypothetical protein